MANNFKAQFYTPTAWSHLLSDYTFLFNASKMKFCYIMCNHQSSITFHFVSTGWTSTNGHQIHQYM